MPQPNLNGLQQESVTPDFISSLSVSCGRESPWKLQEEVKDVPAPSKTTNALAEAAALGVAAMHRSEGRSLSLSPSVEVRETKVTSPAPKRRVKLAESGKPLVECGDILQSTAFGFTVRVQEITEDGGFLGRAPGVGRIRVRGEELPGYAKIGSKV